MSAGAAVLSVGGLTTSFLVEGRWRPVIHDVSFTVGPKETVAIVGESGSGKSVTALSIMRLLPDVGSRSEGSVVIGGRDVLSLSAAEVRHVRGNEIAMIFQEPMTSLNPVLTVGFQIAEMLILHRAMSWSEAEAETLRLLDRVRIAAGRTRYRDYPHAFSGGMRQRAMIAMALACRPRLLIADEPTTALDVTVQAQVLDLLRDLQRDEDMSILFITHDMSVVAEIADRMVVMYRGTAVEEGATGAVFARPDHSYTRALLAAVPRLGSMRGEPLPRRFPSVDVATGRAEPPPPGIDTVVAGGHPILEVRGLTARFDIRRSLLGRVQGRIHAVENASFEVRPGETLALVGESGCGKSTTGRSIMGLVEPQAGSILFDGEDLSRVPRSRLRSLRKHIQMIFQDPFASLNPRMSIGEAIAEPLLAHRTHTRREAEARVAQLLERVGLNGDMVRRYPHEFSGGQRQRICIARALAVDPRLIIADEAVSALDVSVKAQILNLMLDLQASLKLAYLLISHDMAVVEQVSHRVAVMHLGEIVEIGSREAVFGNPQHAYTQKLLAAIPVPDPALARRRPPVPVEEIVNPIRTPDYAAPVRRYREVSHGHLVQL